MSRPRESDRRVPVPMSDAVHARLEALATKHSRSKAWIAARWFEMMPAKWEPKKAGAK